MAESVPSRQQKDGVQGRRRCGGMTSGDMYIYKSITISNVVIVCDCYKGDRSLVVPRCLVYYQVFIDIQVVGQLARQAG